MKNFLLFVMLLSSAACQRNECKHSAKMTNTINFAPINVQSQTVYTGCSQESLTIDTVYYEEVEECNSISCEQ